MRLWLRLAITVVVMLALSYLAGALWLAMFDFPLPSYLAGMVGGLTAVPMWELLKYLASASR